MGIITFWMIQGLLETIAGALQSVTSETVASNQVYGGEINILRSQSLQQSVHTEHPYFNCLDSSGGYSSPQPLTPTPSEQSPVPPTLSVFF